MRVATKLARMIALATALGCASQRIDPHSPGDRCLYSCPEGMSCAGTLFGQGRTTPGRCQLTHGRCMVTADCRPREQCVRAGQTVGVCRPDGLL